MSDQLFNLMNDILKENQSFITKAEPEIGNPDDIVIKCFREEQKSKTSYQPWLIVGLVLFLIIQLIYTNHLYDESIMQLLEVKQIDKELADNYFSLYNNILQQLEFYTMAVLCEFVAFFYFIIRWGFNSTLSELFSDLFVKNSKKKKHNKKGKNS